MAPSFPKALSGLPNKNSSTAAQRTYNVTAMSFTPAQLAASIQRVIPGFAMTYLPDFREGIARSWPASIDDSAARADWGWRPAYTLDVRA